jgi:hypothetical protein
MSKKNFIQKLAGHLGKEISDDIAKELEDELREFKNLVLSNQFLENIPNLEIEHYELLVKTSGQTVNLDGLKTKIEHDKILGVFTISDNANSNYGSQVSVQIDRQFVIADGMFDIDLIKKGVDMSVYESAWRTDIDINTSDVKIIVQDSGRATVPYKMHVYFICRKRETKKR